MLDQNNPLELFHVSVAADVWLVGPGEASGTGFI